MGVPVELRISSSIDLMYHGLAHLPLNNPANLYSKAYLERCGSSKQLGERLESLAPWYTAHFERLCSVGFLPFSAPDWEATKKLLLTHPGYTEEDRAQFLKPLLAAMVRYTGKHAIAYVSCSLPLNGRGVLMREALCAMVAAPAAFEEVADAHHQLLHEYTHAWTDGLLRGPIAMEDGTHDLSEGLVLLADDWLFQLCCPEELGVYRAWAGQMLATDGPVTGEEAAEMIGLGEEWQRRIEVLARTLVAG